MGLSTHDFEVDGRRYRSSAMPAVPALVLLPKLVVLLGHDILNAVLAGADVFSHAVADRELAVSMLVSVSERAQSGELGCIKDLLAWTQTRDRDGSWVDIDFDEHFAGRLGLLIQVATQAAIGSFTIPFADGSPSPSTPSTPA